MKADGKQHIIANDDYVMPLFIKNGLPFLTIMPSTDEQWNSLLHAMLTSDSDCDPSLLDTSGGANEDEWHDAQPSLPKGPSSPLFDEYGELRRGALTHELFYFDAETCNAEDELDDIVDACVLDSHSYLVNAVKNAVTFKNPPDCA